ncbi:MAG: hypothetical protein M3033_14850, partial [Acidobacteriota bacterium]|nr:hypothetical protein [Acidobacteriota bacterium]
MYKTKMQVLFVAMFIFAGSAFAQQSEIEQLFKPDDPTLIVLDNIPNSVSTTIDGQDMTFTVVNNPDGSISITDAQGLQFQVTLTGTGKIAQQIMPNGDVMSMDYKVLNGTSQLLGMHLSGTNYTTDNLMLPSVANGPFPRGGGGSACSAA